MPNKQTGSRYGSNIKAVKNIIEYGCAIGLFKKIDNQYYRRVSADKELINDFLMHKPPVGLSGRTNKNGPVRVTFINGNLTPRASEPNAKYENKIYIKPKTLYDVVKKYNVTGIRFEDIKKLTGYTSDEIRPILNYGQRSGVFCIKGHEMWHVTKKTGAGLDEFFNYQPGMTKIQYHVEKNDNQSKNWNSQTAIKFRAEMERLKELKISDPNTFDRGAMK